jgi:hypothetical protein
VSIGAGRAWRAAKMGNKPPLRGSREVGLCMEREGAVKSLVKSQCGEPKSRRAWERFKFRFDVRDMQNEEERSWKKPSRRREIEKQDRTNKQRKRHGKIKWR